MRLIERLSHWAIKQFIQPALIDWWYERIDSAIEWSREWLIEGSIDEGIDSASQKAQLYQPAQKLASKTPAPIFDSEDANLSLIDSR